MHVFVTGATGVIGRHAIPAMLDAGHTITAVTRSARASTLDRERIATISLSLFDRDAVRRAITGHDAIVHLATHIPRGTVRPFLPGAWSETARLRRDASRILVEAALEAGVTRFVHESFAFAYPDSGNRWVTENIPLEPARYDRAVLDAEAAAAHFHATGRRAVSLRFALLYGPHDAYTQQVIESARRGWLMALGHRDAYLPMLHHADAGTAVAAALEAPAGPYNVVDDEPLTRRGFADVVASLLGVAPPRILPAWMAKLGGSVGETLARSIRLSNAKLRAAGSWQPTHPTAANGWRDALLSMNSQQMRNTDHAHV